MTNRRNRYPAEFRDLKPEEFVDVYQLPDGSLATPTPDSVAALFKRGHYAYAFDLMRHQLLWSAKVALRAAGCTWRRSDALWAADENAELPETISAMIEDASEFVVGLDVADEAARDALEALQSLKWQSDAIAAAGGDPERDTLRRMAIVSTSLGLLSTSMGIAGVFPSMREVKAQAGTGAAVKSGGDKGRETRQAKADDWRKPLADFTEGYAQRHRLSSVEYGIGPKILKAFQSAEPDIQVPSDGPTRLIRTTLEAWLSRPGAA